MIRSISLFYDNSILSGTKISSSDKENEKSFTITQFFQVLKSGTPSVVSVTGFTITQFFQVLKSRPCNRLTCKVLR